MAGEPPGQPTRPLSRPVDDSAPPARRRPILTARESEDFDEEDPVVGTVIIAEVRFSVADPGESDQTSKRRPCVVVAASPSHLLVRPGYSAGGVQSRTWKSVSVVGWRQAGLREPTWIETRTVKVPRQAVGEPVGALTVEDWNSLW